MKKITTLLFCASFLGITHSNAQCTLTGTAIPTACSASTNTYSVSGVIYYVGAPTTGTLTVTNSCGGTQMFPPPFTGSASYNFPGLTANGASCTVMIYFSDLPTCFYPASYTAPAACGTTTVQANAFLTNLSISPNPTNSSFNLSFDQSQEKAVMIEIVDVLGRTVQVETLQKFAGSYNKQVDLTPFNKGIYFVRITGENGAEIRKIIYF